MSHHSGHNAVLCSKVSSHGLKKAVQAFNIPKELSGNDRFNETCS